jgi:hypothetical protein
MRGKRVAAAAAIGVLALAFEAPPSAQAQTRTSAAYSHEVQYARRPRIEIYPARKLVRECTSWLEQEARPSGTVIVPRMRCWWRPG